MSKGNFVLQDPNIVSGKDNKELFPKDGKKQFETKTPIRVQQLVSQLQEQKPEFKQFSNQQFQPIIIQQGQSQDQDKDKDNNDKIEGNNIEDVFYSFANYNQDEEDEEQLEKLQSDYQNKRLTKDEHQQVESQFNNVLKAVQQGQGNLRDAYKYLSQQIDDVGLEQFRDQHSNLLQKTEQIVDENQKLEEENKRIEDEQIQLQEENKRMEDEYRQLEEQLIKKKNDIEQLISQGQLSPESQQVLLDTFMNGYEQQQDIIKEWIQQHQKLMTQEVQQGQGHTFFNQTQQINKRYWIKLKNRLIDTHVQNIIKPINELIDNQKIQMPEALEQQILQQLNQQLREYEDKLQQQAQITQQITSDNQKLNEDIQQLKQIADDKEEQIKQIEQQRQQSTQEKDLLKKDKAELEQIKQQMIKLQEMLEIKDKQLIQTQNKIIPEQKTKQKYNFSQKELNQIIKKFEAINLKKYSKQEVQDIARLLKFDNELIIELTQDTLYQKISQQIEQIKQLNGKDIPKGQIKPQGNAEQSSSEQSSSSDSDKDDFDYNQKAGIQMWEEDTQQLFQQQKQKLINQTIEIKQQYTNTVQITQKLQKQLEDTNLSVKQLKDNEEKLKKEISELEKIQKQSAQQQAELKQKTQGLQQLLDRQQQLENEVEITNNEMIQLKQMNYLLKQQVKQFDRNQQNEQQYSQQILKLQLQLKQTQEDLQSRASAQDQQIWQINREQLVEQLNLAKQHSHIVGSKNQELNEQYAKLHKDVQQKQKQILQMQQQLSQHLSESMKREKPEEMKNRLNQEITQQQQQQLKIGGGIGKVQIKATQVQPIIKQQIVFKSPKQEIVREYIQYPDSNNKRQIEQLQNSLSSLEGDLYQKENQINQLSEIYYNVIEQNKVLHKERNNYEKTVHDLNNHINENQFLKEQMQQQNQKIENLKNGLDLIHRQQQQFVRNQTQYIQNKSEEEYAIQLQNFKNQYDIDNEQLKIENELLSKNYEKLKVQLLVSKQNAQQFRQESQIIEQKIKQNMSEEEKKKIDQVVQDLQKEFQKNTDNLEIEIKKYLQQMQYQDKQINNIKNQLSQNNSSDTVDKEHLIMENKQLLQMIGEYQRQQQQHPYSARQSHSQSFSFPQENYEEQFINYPQSDQKRSSLDQQAEEILVPSQNLSSLGKSSFAIGNYDANQFSLMKNMSHKQKFSQHGSDVFIEPSSSHNSIQKDPKGRNVAPLIPKNSSEFISEDRMDDLTRQTDDYMNNIDQQISVPDGVEPHQFAQNIYDITLINENPRLLAQANSNNINVVQSSIHSQIYDQFKKYEFILQRDLPKFRQLIFRLNSAKQLAQRYNSRDHYSDWQLRFLNVDLQNHNQVRDNKYQHLSVLPGNDDLLLQLFNNGYIFTHQELIPQGAHQMKFGAEQQEDQQDSSDSDSDRDDNHKPQGRRILSRKQMIQDHAEAIEHLQNRVFEINDEQQELQQNKDQIKQQLVQTKQKLLDLQNVYIEFAQKHTIEQQFLEQSNNAQLKYIDELENKLSQFQQQGEQLLTQQQLVNNVDEQDVQVEDEILHDQINDYQTQVDNLKLILQHDYNYEEEEVQTPQLDQQPQKIQKQQQYSQQRNGEIALLQQSTQDEAVGYDQQQQKRIKKQKAPFNNAENARLEAEFNDRHRQRVAQRAANIQQRNINPSQVPVERPRVQNQLPRREEQFVPPYPINNFARGPYGPPQNGPYRNINIDNANAIRMAAPPNSNNLYQHIPVSRYSNIYSNPYLINRPNY